MIDDVYKANKSERYHDGYHSKSQKHHNILLYIAARLFRSKALITAAVLIFLTLGAIGIWLLVTLLPFVGQLLSISGKAGDKGHPGCNSPVPQDIMGRFGEMMG